MAVIMRKNQKKLPIGPIAVVLAVTLVITAVGTLFGGKEKAEAIAGALRTKMIDTLITDEYTAKQVLQYC